MGVIERLIGIIINITKNLDMEVEKGFNLSKWGDQMKFLHALQVQAQALIDLVQRIASLMGYTPSTYIESGKVLLNEGLMNEEDFKLYRAIVGFRNIVVHEYVEVNMSLVENLLRKREYRKILDLAEKIYRKAKIKGLDP